jgi:hypothetical protein
VKLSKTLCKRDHHQEFNQDVDRNPMWYARRSPPIQEPHHPAFIFLRHHRGIPTAAAVCSLHSMLLYKDMNPMVTKSHTSTCCSPPLCSKRYHRRHASTLLMQNDMIWQCFTTAALPLLLNHHRSHPQQQYISCFVGAALGHCHKGARYSLKQARWLTSGSNNVTLPSTVNP